VTTTHEKGINSLSLEPPNNQFTIFSYLSSLAEQHTTKPTICSSTIEAMDSSRSSSITVVPEKESLKSRLHSAWIKYKPLIPAKNSLDDVYNFTSGDHSSWGGEPYNFPAVKRRGVDY